MQEEELHKFNLCRTKNRFEYALSPSDALRVRRPDRGRSPKVRCLLHGGFVRRIAMQMLDMVKKKPDPLDGFRWTA